MEKALTGWATSKGNELTSKNNTPGVFDVAWFASAQDTTPKPLPDKKPQVKWTDLIELFATHAQTPDKGSTGGFIGGLVEGTRGNDNVKSRGLVTLDYDNVTGTFTDEVKAANVLKGCPWIAYTTHSHSSEHPRWRLVIPLKYPVSVEHWRHISQALVEHLNVTALDKSKPAADKASFTPAQIMYLPTCPPGAAHRTECATGSYYLSPDDFPIPSADEQNTSSNAHRTDEHPAAVVGDVSVEGLRVEQNTVQRINQALPAGDCIRKYLAEVYEPHPSDSTRFTYCEGTGQWGVKVDEHNGAEMAFIHHSTDPAGGEYWRGSFDLVRVHLCGGSADDTGMSDGSFARAMCWFGAHIGIPERLETGLKPSRDEHKPSALEDFGPEIMEELTRDETTDDSYTPTDLFDENTQSVWRRYHKPPRVKHLNSAYTVQQWEELERTLFDQTTPALETFFMWCRRRNLSPVSTLVAYLQALLCCTPPQCVANIGEDKWSLNTFVALVAVSGGGKSKAVRAVDEVARVFIGSTGGDALPPEFRYRVSSAASGEGLLTELVPAGDGFEGSAVTNPRVLFSYGEVSQLQALEDRKGNNTRSYLVLMFDGDGMTNGTKKNPQRVEKGTYRGGLRVLTQTDTGAVLTGAKGDGFTERFAFAHVLNPFTPDSSELAGVLKRDTALSTALPSLVVVSSEDMERGFMFPEPVVLELGNEFDERQRTGKAGDGDARWGDVAVRLACGLALMHSRMTVTQDDWTRAKALVKHSQATREWLSRCVRAHNQVEADKRYDAEVESKKQRVMDVLIKRFDGCATKNALLKLCGSGTGGYRDGSEAALLLLQAEKRVKIYEGKANNNKRCEFVTVCQ